MRGVLNAFKSSFKDENVKMLLSKDAYFCFLNFHYRFFLINDSFVLFRKATNTKQCLKMVHVFVCLFAFFSAIWNLIGIPFGTKSLFGPEKVLKQ